ncbi:SMI1/KNR4 family protein [Microbacterium sp. 179-I 3D2 NHS]|uniref:SMI1/KNR4 family protein n=1 Tax=Microbacterium sp. 179-I 3D2 NHS TaxID=3235178 RepID=UPI00399FD2EF
MTNPPWLDALADEAGRMLHLGAPVTFPQPLRALMRTAAPSFALDAARLPEGRWSSPAPEFGPLGADMADYYRDYEFAEYMPGAWPLALDGSGGFYCLDLREVIAGTRANDGSAPVVWSHAGSLGWDDDQCLPITADPATFFEAAVPGP